MSTENEITMPDFKLWSHNIIEEYGQLKYSNCTVTVYSPLTVELALKQAFYQGRTLGQREQKQVTTGYSVSGVF